VRGPEGIAALLPGRSSESTWSKHREPHIRNVEAVGSDPITSTRKSRSVGVIFPVNRASSWFVRDPCAKNSDNSCASGPGELNARNVELTSPEACLQGARPVRFLVRDRDIKSRSAHLKRTFR
jgi:hypothetical protein